MIRFFLRAATLLLLPAVCAAQHPRRAADTSFKASDYSLDRDFSAPSAGEGAKSDDGKSVRRFGAHDAGITAAAKLLIAAAPDAFKSVRIESSKQADELFGGSTYDGRVQIDGGVWNTRPYVEFEDGVTIYRMPLLRSAAKEAATLRVQALLKALSPALGAGTTAAKPSESVGILHYDFIAGSERPALRLEQVGGDLTLFVYPKGAQLEKR